MLQILVLTFFAFLLLHKRLLCTHCLSLLSFFCTDILPRRWSLHHHHHQMCLVGFVRKVDEVIKKKVCDWCWTHCQQLPGGILKRPNQFCSSFLCDWLRVHFQTRVQISTVSSCSIFRASSSQYCTFIVFLFTAIPILFFSPRMSFACLFCMLLHLLDTAPPSDEKVMWWWWNLIITNKCTTTTATVCHD